MKLYQIKSKQILPMMLDDAWNFFSNPKNLSKITPPWLNLKITSDLPDKMYEGMIITYKVYPFLGISANWVTEITQLKDRKFFIDEQRLGPYKFWHHQHHLKEDDQGIEIIDIVNYAIPFDPISRLLNKLIVRKRIEEIFEYRKGALNDLLLID